MLSTGPFLDFYNHPYNYNVEPFKIVGNVYYVGDQRVCLHLIDTGDGLVLIDTGYPTSKALYIENIYHLGFDPHNIKYIIHTHEHFDHFGCTADFVKLYGCKSVMSRRAAQVFKERPEATLYRVPPCHLDPTECPIDVIVDSSSRLTVGNTTFEFKESPGHGEGVLTIFFNTEENGTVYRCALFGGASVITCYREHFVRYNIPFTVRGEFLSSVRSLRGEKVDVVLGNHPYQNATLEKRQKQRKDPLTNPFIDPSEWEEFLDSTENMLIAFNEFDPI